MDEVDTMDKDGQNETKAPGGSRSAFRMPRSLLALAAIVAVAAALRLYRIEEQSLWWDDAPVAVLNIDAPSLGAFLAEVYAPGSPEGEHVPAYYIALYLWGRCVGSSLVSLRLLGVFLSLATLPWLYLSGRALFGRVAGLTAALCFALSPEFIWYAQGIRVYALLVPVAAVSLYAMVRIIQSPHRGWWLLNWAANVLLVWTHLFALFFIVAQGCLLLLLLPRRKRPVLLWGAAHGLALIPSALWALRIQDIGPYAYVAFSAATLSGFLSDLFAADTRLGGGKASLANVWPRMQGGRIVWDLPSCLDVGVFLFFLTSCLRLGVRTVRAYVGGCPAADVDGRRRQAEGWTLLLLVALLPLLLLAVLSHVWRPCFSDRYALYSCLAMYLIGGGAVQAVRRPWLQGAAMALLACAYGYYLSQQLPLTTRTDWRGAANLVRTEAAPDDVIFVGSSCNGAAYLGLDMFRYHLGEFPTPSYALYGMQALCDYSECFLWHNRPSGSPRVWAVLSQSCQPDLLPPLEAALAARGLVWHKRTLAGGNGLAVYCIEAGEPRAPSAPEAPPVETDVDYERIVEENGFTFPTEDARKRAMASLRRYVNIQPPPVSPDGVPGFVDFGFFLAQDPSPDLTLAVAKKALEMTPDCRPAQVLLGIALLKQGSFQEAGIAFRKGFAAEPNAASFEPLINALCETRDLEKARDEAQRLRASGVVLPAALCAEAGLPDPDVFYCP